ncbi:hypothetical protein EBT25_15865 [bacterium]|nr:hypothetical protein [bacterium]
MRKRMATDRMIQDNERPISEEYRIIAKKWVDADAAASLLEETKSSVLARYMTDLVGDMSVSKAEMIVKASDEWREFITNMVNARKEASKLKVQLEYIRMKFSEWQSFEASKRAEMRL